MLRISSFEGLFFQYVNDCDVYPGFRAYLVSLYCQVLAILRHQTYNKDCETNDYYDNIILILLVWASENLYI